MNYAISYDYLISTSLNPQSK